MVRHGSPAVAHHDDPGLQLDAAGPLAAPMRRAWSPECCSTAIQARLKFTPHCSREATTIATDPAGGWEDYLNLGWAGRGPPSALRRVGTLRDTIRRQPPSLS